MTCKDCRYKKVCDDTHKSDYYINGDSWANHCATFTFKKKTHKIKHKGILFEHIQGFVSTRHYILPYLINNDKELQNQLKIFNGILVDNKLSSSFMNNLYCFISDRILFRIINEEKNIMDDNLYVQAEEENEFKKLKKRILGIYKFKKNIMKQI